MVNWRSYNESPVGRGEVMLDFDVTDGWHGELEKMNEGREEGASFRYPHYPLLSNCSGTCALLFPPAVCTDRLKVLLSGRMQGGKRCTVHPRLRHPLQTHQQSGHQAVDDEEKVGNNIIVIALDSTGMKVANRGEWMRHKWHVRRGYLKIHVAVDIRKKKVVSLQVTTSEDVYTTAKGAEKKLVKGTSEKYNGDVGRVLVDDACTTARRVSVICLLTAA